MRKMYDFYTKNYRTVFKEINRGIIKWENIYFWIRRHHIKKKKRSKVSVGGSHLQSSYLCGRLRSEGLWFEPSPGK
jgi:hypothetical protein